MDFEERCGIPELHRDFDWGKLPDAKYVQVCRRFIDNYEEYLESGMGLLLWGPYSHGKSALACEFLRELPRGKTGLFVSGVNIPGYIIEGTPFDSRNTYDDRMKRVDLLVIDEFILHEGSTFRDTCVELLVRHRISEMRSTIITTNHSTDHIKRNYEAFFEASLECFIPLKVEGHNFRREKATEIMERFEGKV